MCVVCFFWEEINETCARFLVLSSCFCIINHWNFLLILFSCCGKCLIHWQQFEFIKYVKVLFSNWKFINKMRHQKKHINAQTKCIHVGEKFINHLKIRVQVCRIYSPTLQLSRIKIIYNTLAVLLPKRSFTLPPYVSCERTN